MARPPFHVDDFVGQRKNIAPLLRQQDGALTRGEPLSHCLFSGMSGLGKSLMARTLASRVKTNTIKFLGDVSLTQVVEGLARMREGDIAFFDEAHNLSNEVQELLFNVIDAREVPAGHAPGAKSKEPLRLAVTLIFATDRPGKLLTALLRRIGIRVHFAPYPEAELKEIVERVADRRGLLFSPQSARRLARMCNGLPRRAEHLVTQIRHHFPDAEQRKFTVSDVVSFLREWGIDRHGLGRQERRYLRFIAQNGAASLETLASYLGLDLQYVKGQVEQPLRYRGLLRITSSGRVLTRRGQTLVGRWRSAHLRKEED
jgi:Holliday junction DNA helicase RuvB